jgi:hypothetical protein
MPMWWLVLILSLASISLSPAFAISDDDVHAALMQRFQGSAAFPAAILRGSPKTARTSE